LNNECYVHPAQEWRKLRGWQQCGLHQLLPCATNWILTRERSDRPRPSWLEAHPKTDKRDLRDWKVQCTHFTINWVMCVWYIYIFEFLYSTFCL
jgi:hypothetical protein